MIQLLLTLVPAVALPPPQLAPAHAARAPAIDGKLDEPVWIGATPGASFVQKFPAEGAEPGDLTQVRVLYDDATIYIGVECAQARAPVVARLTRRDRQVESDRVEIDLGTRGDGKSAFHFEVNAAGVLVDGLRYDDTELDLSWDANWEAAAHRSGEGWTAEIAIPLRLLRFPALASQTWGFQVRRYVSARQEIDEWAFIPRSAAGEVSRYGALGPFEGLGGSLRPELLPFVLARLRRRDPTPDTLASGTDVHFSAGGDARLHLTPDLTLDATVLPDFAQVEADQLVLNLTTYETFFPEKRPFFLEGLDAFAVPVPILYTRRIGHVPDVPALANDEALVDAPEPSAILGAAKLAGRFGERLGVGALAAVTGRNEVLVEDSTGKRSPRLAEPLTLYAALRIKEDVGGNAHLGVMGTAVARGDRARFHDAYVAALDGRWRSPSGDYILSGMALGSLVSGGPPRQREDGTLLSAGDLAPGAMLRAAKEGGRWLFDVTYEGYAPRFDIDDLGYLSRANLHSVSAVGEHRDRIPGDILLESSWRLELFHRRNIDWLKLADLYQINTSGKLRSFWEYFVELHYRAAHFDDREVGDGTALERAGLVGLEVSLSSDPRGRVVGSIWTQTQRLSNGWNFASDGSLSLRVLPQLDLELLPSATFTTGEPRYTGVATGAGSALFGRLDASSFGLTLRSTYTFTPRLTLQAYAQVFLASVHYADFTSATTTVIHLEDLAAAPPPAQNPDEEEAVVNANIVLRWEWRLGSTVYLVYTRGQSSPTAIAPGALPRLDVGAALRAPAADVFLLKCSFWWA